jgi:hypothetical protein
VLWDDLGQAEPDRATHVPPFLLPVLRSDPVQRLASSRRCRRIRHRAAQGNNPVEVRLFNVRTQRSVFSKEQTRRRTTALL